MWWAVDLVKDRRAIQDRWCTPGVLNQQSLRDAWSFGPTQMAIPLQMDEDPKQLVAANRRVLGVTRTTHTKE
jgi:hypothetical protein